MSVRPYSSYKSSGFEWLGTIPAHWWIGRLKFVADAWPSNVDKHIHEHEQPVLLCNYVDVYNNEFITSELELMQGSASQSEIDKFALRKGDVIITKDSESWDDIAVPAFVSDNLTGVICGYHLTIVRAHPDSFDPRYLFRLFCSELMNYQFKIEANGVTRFGLPISAINNAILLKPPLDEQEAIVEFIDEETARVDDLIKAMGGATDADAIPKDSFIGLLYEYRSAIINNAVTGKFDVRMTKQKEVAA
jgi:type I restriction enzyme S subunit